MRTVSHDVGDAASVVVGHTQADEREAEAVAVAVAEAEAVVQQLPAAAPG